MIPFQDALKAKLPFIGVRTDDIVNVKAILQSIAGRSVMPLPKITSVPVGHAYLWMTFDVKEITPEWYKKLAETTASCVVINADKPSSLVFETGPLPTPNSFYVSYLKEFVEEANIPPIVKVLQGLSLKTAMETVQLTMARSGSTLPHEIRKTRQMMGSEHPGLSTLDTNYDFYEWPKELKEWYDLNTSYFLNHDVPQQLVPRGLLLSGDPGVGKTMAAQVLAKQWDVPLFRLDVSESLNRYLGESESRIATSLKILDQNAPCVLIIDEAEKLFGGGHDEGTSRRILSQILWWLQYRKARVMTIMTTNNLDSLPKELYRAERLDRIIKVEKLSFSGAQTFAYKVYETVLKDSPSPARKKMINAVLEHDGTPTFAHAKVRVLVYELIKAKNWLQEKQS